MTGSLTVVGIGPGTLALTTPAASEALEQADIILGYKTYVSLIDGLAPRVPRETSGMRSEVERAARAIDLARAGKRVALVSGGDPGIYGMAGLVFEVLRERGHDDLAVEVIPGVPALCAVAALLGAPLMHDFAAISLSDLLLPLDEILWRLDLAAQADFVLCLYNPQGRNRTEPFRRACEVLARHRAPSTPVGVVRSAYREGQAVTVTTLADLPQSEVDMTTLVIVGNSRTFVHSGRMVTPRGYGDKYALGAASGGLPADET